MNYAEQKSRSELLQEIEDLRYQLAISEETLEAIKTGAVDAIAITGENGPQIFTLRNADQTYRALVERMNEGAVILNDTGIITYCNAQFATLVNYPLSKTIGLPFSNFLPEDYRQQFSYVFLQAWKEQIKQEFILIPADNTTLHVFLSLNVIDTLEGFVIGMIVTDLSIQKERKNLESLFSQAPAIINILKGPEHIFELPHPAMVQLLGKDVKGMKAKDVFLHHADNNFFEILDTVFHSANSHQDLEVQRKMITSDGDLKDYFFNISYQPWFDIYRKVQGVMTFAIDVTEQVNSRRKSEENARHFKMLMESIPQMAWTTNPSGKGDFYNNRWYEYIGNKAERAQWNWQEIIHPEDYQRTMDAFWSAFNSGQIYEIENRYKRGSDGSYRWHMNKSIPLKNEQGEIILWVGTSTDIHEQKTVREKMTLMNLELRKKNEELLKINNDLDNFVYTASHDLKAPVSNIEGLVSALAETIQQQGTESEDINNILQLINDSITRFKNTIVDLTEITKIQKGLEEDAEIINGVEIIEDVKVDLRALIKQSKAQITTELNHWHTLAFSKKNFKSIIYNLLSNAIKYRSFERIPEIVIKTDKVEGFLLLIVQDNGLGMDLRKETKIFSMFKRLHDHVEGTGVGLYLVKRIIDNAGGKIEVESEVGVGSTFKLYFKN